jgi:hypothetical protein
LVLAPCGKERDAANHGLGATLARVVLTFIRVFETLRERRHDIRSDAVPGSAHRRRHDRDADRNQTEVQPGCAPEVLPFDGSHEIVILAGVTTQVKVRHVWPCWSWGLLRSSTR